MDDGQSGEMERKERQLYMDEPGSEVIRFVPFEMRVRFHESFLVLTSQFCVFLLLIRIESCPPFAKNLGYASILEMRILRFDHGSVSLAKDEEGVHGPLLRGR